jgi:glutamyl-tRNA(Gln) amidotransferase subunit D
VLKLESGYNVGFLRSNIRKIEKIKGVSQKKESIVAKIKDDPNKKTIVILHTGGTIASRVDYETGAVGTTFLPEELISLFPELKDHANVRSRLVKNMWSQDMRFVHYNLIAKEIKKEIDSGVSGIIVSQGTDTLHYTAAALSFALENLNVPVLVVGAQRSSDRPSTDARDNLINAVYFISKSNFADVGICMHASTDDSGCNILSATKTRKNHTSRRDAFRSINSEPYAMVDYRNSKIEYLNTDYNVNRERKLRLKLFKEDLRVGLLKQHTNMYADQFFMFKRYDGLVIESTGLGCLPISEKDRDTRESGRILNAIKSLIKHGVVVAEAPETINGRLVLNVYEDQRVAQDIGVIGSFSDMTPETSFIKLSWLLSNYKRDEVRSLYVKNLRGELSETSTYDSL